MALIKVNNRGQSADFTTEHGGERNFIINGAMKVAQRSTSLTVGDSTEYKTLDRFAIGINGTTAGRATMSQSTDAPAGFGYSMKFDVTTADTSIGSGESFGVFQRIEGQNVQHMNKGTSSAKKCVFSFYAKGTPKKYITEFRDDNSRQVSATFDVTTSWQRFEIEVPADTTGTIDNDNSAGFIALFWIHAGSDYTSGTLNTSWGTSTNANRMVGCESIFSSTSNELLITGIQLEVGETATPFEHEPFSVTLQKCQRYYFDTASAVNGKNGTTIAGGFIFKAFNGNEAAGYNTFPVTMRAVPTITCNDNAGTQGKIHRYGHSDVGSNIAFGNISASGITACSQSGTFATASGGLNIYGARIRASAEL